MASPLAALALFACGEPVRKLDEYRFYDGPQFSLKVVRYYRNIPFQDLGEQAVVMCESAHTRDLAGDGRQQDAGWRPLGSVAGRDGASAAEIAAGLQDDYTVLDDLTLAANTGAFNISFDACGHFIHWDPARLPAVLLEAAENPADCAPDAAADCAYRDFGTGRAPRYERIRVTGPGQVSFTARAAAFRGTGVLHVRTVNNGVTWHVEPAGPAAEGHEALADTLRALPVAALEAGLQDGTLAAWLEAALPPGSMVIWPSAPAACGTGGAAEGMPPAAQCAVLHFRAGAGNSAALSLQLRPVPAQAVVHSGVCQAGSEQQAIGSLTALRACLADGS